MKTHLHSLQIEHIESINEKSQNEVFRSIFVQCDDPFIGGKIHLFNLKF